MAQHPRHLYPRSYWRLHNSESRQVSICDGRIRVGEQWQMDKNSHDSVTVGPSEAILSAYLDLSAGDIEVLLSRAFVGSRRCPEENARRESGRYV